MYVPVDFAYKVDIQSRESQTVQYGCNSNHCQHIQILCIKLQNSEALFILFIIFKQKKILFKAFTAIKSLIFMKCVLLLSHI